MEVKGQGWEVNGGRSHHLFMYVRQPHTIHRLSLSLPPSLPLLLSSSTSSLLAPPLTSSLLAHSSCPVSLNLLSSCSLFLPCLPQPPLFLLRSLLTFCPPSLLPLPSSPHLLPLVCLSQFVQCFSSLLDKSAKQPCDVECIRVFLTMTASPIFNVNELERVLDLFIKYCQVLTQLHPKALEVLS